MIVLCVFCHRMVLVFVFRMALHPPSLFCPWWCTPSLSHSSLGHPPVSCPVEERYAHTVEPVYSGRCMFNSLGSSLLKSPPTVEIDICTQHLIFPRVRSIQQNLEECPWPLVVMITLTVHQGRKRCCCGGLFGISHTCTLEPAAPPWSWGSRCAMGSGKFPCTPHWHASHTAETVFQMGTVLVERTGSTVEQEIRQPFGSKVQWLTCQTALFACPHLHHPSLLHVLAFMRLVLAFRDALHTFCKKIQAAHHCQGGTARVFQEWGIGR